MIEDFSGNEKREFLRYDFDKPIHFNSINSPKDRSFSEEMTDAISKNLSASGLLFITSVQKVPHISSILILDLDHRTASICKEIEGGALVVNNKLMGRVVRIEDNEDGTCGVGVAFVTKADSRKAEIQKLIS